MVDHDAQRRAIASAAIDAIDEAGLDGARLKDVAAAAQVTTGAVTHYFDGKDAVLMAAHEEIMRRILDRQSDPLRGDLGEIAAAFLPLDDASRREWRVWLAFCGRAVVNEDLRARHKAYYRAIVERVAERLVAAQRHRVSMARARRQADAVIAAIDGVGFRATLEPEDWPPARQRAVLRMLLEPALEEDEIV